MLANGGGTTRCVSPLGARNNAEPGKKFQRIMAVRQVNWLCEQALWQHEEALCGGEK